MMDRKRPLSSSSNSTEQRNVILFDLDCFYAQCYCIRYGFDVTTTALALFQWNSVLAVTYPARKLYNIQRGDTWENVATKSQQKCICVHVPISTISTGSTHDRENKTMETTAKDLQSIDTCDTGSDTDNDLYTLKAPQLHNENSNNEVVSTTTSTRKTLLQEYRELFQLSTPQEQQAAQAAEINVRKYSTQGKANIEIFRIASAMILQLVHTCLQEFNNSTCRSSSSSSRNQTNQSHHHMILERASIDEFFVDVTHFVHHQSDYPPNQEEIDEAMKHTVIISQESKQDNHLHEDKEEDDYINQNDDHDDDSILQLRYSCAIAYQIRQRVYNTLGFHMSAGVGINKTLAKLAASFGKPAGQAVLYPHYISHMLHTTPIKKCRHLGGKVGKQILSLLPPNVPPTLGSVVQYVSLPQLKQELHSMEMAQKIYDLVRGIDHEPVESKNPDSSAVLTKSITAFKSLRFSSTGTMASTTGNTVCPHRENNNNFADGHTLPEAMKWIDLLVKEIISRVDRDTQRNERYPKNLVIQYYTHDATSNPRYSHQNNKSIRIPFPSYQLSNDERVRLLLSIVPNTLQEKVVTKQKLSTYRFHRIGLCAIDFESIKSGSKGIDTYFLVASTTASSNGNVNKKNKGNPLIAATPKPLSSFIPDDQEKETIPEIDIQEESVQSDDVVESSPQMFSSVTVSSTKRDDTTGSCSDRLQQSAVEEQEAEADDDYAMAKKLQAAYDHEDRSLKVMEKKRNNALSSMSHRKQQQPPVRKINSFFQKK